jgi:hypothetical protein
MDMLAVNQLGHVLVVIGGFAMLRVFAYIIREW